MPTIDLELKAAGKYKWTPEDFCRARHLATIFTNITAFAAQSDEGDNTLMYMAVLLILWKITQQHKDSYTFDEFRAHLYEDIETINKALVPLYPENDKEKKPS